MALDQPMSCRSNISLSGFPYLEPMLVLFRKFLIIKPSSSQRVVFPHWVFPGTICPEITVSLCLCVHELVLDLDWWESVMFFASILT